MMNKLSQTNLKFGSNNTFATMSAADISRPPASAGAVTPAPSPAVTVADTFGSPKPQLEAESKHTGWKIAGGAALLAAAGFALKKYHFDPKKAAEAVENFIGPPTALFEKAQQAAAEAAKKTAEKWTLGTEPLINASKNWILKNR